MTKNNLKRSIEKYENAIETYGHELNKIKNEINEALFEEEIITVKTKVNENENIVRIIDDYISNNYSIPVFTDEDEYNQGINFYEFQEQEIEVRPYKTNIKEFIEIAMDDVSFDQIIINPHSLNFIVDMASVIEYNEKY